MKKKQIANLVMVLVILAIVVAGVLTVGHVRGWFDKDNGTYAVLQDIRGIIYLERDGVSYPVEKETVLRDGDKLSCAPGATATICEENNRFTIGEKATLTITNPEVEAFSAELLSGEMFANCEHTATITFDGKKIEFSQATALFSVRAGAQSVSVLRGQVKNATSGQILNYVGDVESVGTLDIHSLNDFGITQIRKYDGSISLCFTTEDLDLLMAERQQAQQELINSQGTTTTPGTDSTEPENSNPTTGTTGGTGTTGSTGTTGTTGTSQPTTPSGTTTDPGTEKPTPPSTTTPETTPPTTSGGGQCTITIRCDTILDNMADLTPGKAGYVPGDGVILYPVSVKFESGDTVYDVLKRVCDINGIQLEYSWTPLYGSYYIEGINQLYEFDCGNESGWMYKVNGWFPNYGCSSYTLKDGDVIVWAYTCHGLGTDVGAPEWTG